jgi:hypothetical protein
VGLRTSVAGTLRPSWQLCAGVITQKDEEMSTWYSKNLGDGNTAFGATGQIQEAFLSLAKAQDVSPEIAVFSSHDLETNIVTVYFTPSAELLAKSFGASPSDKPEPADGFSLLVGDANSWETHFPGYLASRREIEL